MVSQPKPATGKSPYYDIAEKYGIEVAFRPFVKTVPVSAKEFRSQRLNLADYTAVVFTSKIGIDNYFALCEANRVIVPETMRYFCTTESVALYLQKYIVYRKRKIVFGKTGKLDELEQQLVKHSKEKFLIPVADVFSDDQFGVFKKLKIDYTTAVMYRTVTNDFEEGEDKSFDVFLFFTAVGVQCYINNFKEVDPKSVVLGAFGPAAVDAVKESNLELHIEAPTPTALSMPAALDAYLSKHLKAKE